MSLSGVRLWYFAAEALLVNIWHGAAQGCNIGFDAPKAWITFFRSRGVRDSHQNHHHHWSRYDPQLRQH